MRTRRLVHVYGCALVLLAAGCSGPVPGTTSPSTSSSPTAPSSTAAAPTPVAPPTPPAGTRPVVACLNGTYRLIRITDVDPGAPYESVRGGDVELQFTGAEFPDGNYVGTAYRLRAAGQRSLTLTSPAGVRSTLVATVRATGSYTLENSRATFAPPTGKGSGSGSLTSGGATTRVDLAGVEDVVAPVGLLTVSCTRTTLWLTGSSAQYELALA